MNLMTAHPAIFSETTAFRIKSRALLKNDAHLTALILLWLAYQKSHVEKYGFTARIARDRAQKYTRHRLALARTPPLSNAGSYCGQFMGTLVPSTIR